MELPEDDVSYLRKRGVQFELTAEANVLCVVFPGYRLPTGFDSDTADLLVRLPGGYPDAAPDMWWFDPAIRGRDGTNVPATDSVEIHLGRSWQRWSRHLEPGQWKSGIDGLESYLALIKRELEDSVARVPA